MAADAEDTVDEVEEQTEESSDSSESSDDTEAAASVAAEEDDSDSQAGEEEESSESASEEEQEQELISEEEIGALKDNPKALRKALNRSYTQKTQELARMRQELSNAQQLLDSLKADPVGTVKILTAMAGLKVAEPENKQERDELSAELEKILGPELAGQFAPIIEKLADRQAQKVMGPVRQRQEQQLKEAAEAQTQSVMAQMDKKYPGWKKHETRMLEYAKKLSANVSSGITEGEYAELLYRLSTMDEHDGDVAADVVDRVNRNAGKTPAANRSAPPKKVTVNPGKNVSLREALEMAQKGQVVGE